VHLLVRDAGQIAPFTTVTEALHWRGLPEDPVRTALNVFSNNPAIHTRVHHFRSPGPPVDGFSAIRSNSAINRPSVGGGP
jgi:hypothetical protein